MAFEQIKGNWNIVKGSLREQWGKLTDDDLEVVKGDFEQLSGRIQKTYGITKDEADQKVSEWKLKNQKTSFGAA